MGVLFKPQRHFGSCQEKKSMWSCSELGCEIIKLFLAAVVGGIIGFERETHGQAAGLRTNVLVCTGGCLLMMLSLHIAHIFRDVNMTESVIRLDPARIASYAIASMGFLGAGAIITGKGTVKGLTTAASMWLVTAIGLAIGAGFFVPALTSMFLSLIVLYGFRRIKQHLPKDEHTLLTLVFDQAPGPMERIKSILTNNNIIINFINYHLDQRQNIVTYKLRLQSKMDIPWGHLVSEMRKAGELREMSWEEGMVI
jgi:putative Mg2+ transporter-C (MgtC) family protein